MIAIAIIIMLGILVICIFGDKLEYNVPVISLLLVTLFVVGVLVGNDYPKSSKKKITPKIKVECEDNKCDTTYIYE